MNGPLKCDSQRVYPTLSLGFLPDGYEINPKCLAKIQSGVTGSINKQHLRKSGRRSCRNFGVFSIHNYLYTFFHFFFSQGTYNSLACTPASSHSQFYINVLFLLASTSRPPRGKKWWNGTLIQRDTLRKADRRLSALVIIADLAGTDYQPVRTKYSISWGGGVLPTSPSTPTRFLPVFRSIKGTSRLEQHWPGCYLISSPEFKSGRTDEVSGSHRQTQASTVPNVESERRQLLLPPSLSLRKMRPTQRLFQQRLFRMTKALRRLQKNSPVYKLWERLPWAEDGPADLSRYVMK